MAKATYKQIAKAIEDGKAIEAKKVICFYIRNTMMDYYVTIDGTEYEVSAASWNKFYRNTQLHQIGFETISRTNIVRYAL